MKALIVCYSYSGNTYRVAQAIQQMTQAELCQIFPSQPWRSAWALPRRTSSPTRGHRLRPLGQHQHHSEEPGVLQPRCGENRQGLHPGAGLHPLRRPPHAAPVHLAQPVRQICPRHQPGDDCRENDRVRPALRAAHLPGRRARHVCVQQFISHHPQQLVLNFPHRLVGGGEQICPHPGKIDAGLVDVAFRHRDGDYPLERGTFGIFPGCWAIYIENRRKLLRSLRRKKRGENKKTGPPAWKNQGETPLLAVECLGHLR